MLDPLALNAGWHVCGQHILCRSSPESVLEEGGSPMGSETGELLVVVLPSRLVADASLERKQWTLNKHTSRSASGAPPGGRYPYGILSTDAISQ